MTKAALALSAVEKDVNVDYSPKHNSVIIRRLPEVLAGDSQHGLHGHIRLE